MSGGVDSAVAAALAVDAGHDVTGVHLALSPDRQTLRSGARGCCSVEDAHDARRVADELGIPFYVWDLAERFARGRRRRLRGRVRGRPDAEPVPALQREDQVLRRAGPGAGARLRRRRHRPPRPAGRRRAAPVGRRRQGPVLRARRADAPTSSPAAMFPLGSMTKDRVREIAAERGLRRGRQARLATTSASSPTATPGASWPGGSAAGPARSSTRPPARRSGSTTARTGSRSGSARASASASATSGRATCLGIEPVTPHGDDRHPGPGRHRRGAHRARRPGPGRAPVLPFDAPRCSCGRTPRRSPARSVRATTAGCGSRSPRSSAVWLRGSPRCSTSRTRSAVTGCWGRPLCCGS